MTIAPTIRPVRFVLVVAAVLGLVAVHLVQLHHEARPCLYAYRVMPPPRTLTRLVRQRYLSSVPRDSWNRPLRLVCPSRHAGGQPCDVSSAGSDGIFGTDDDINSWDL
jgi:hypothetical protein